VKAGSPLAAQHLRPDAMPETKGVILDNFLPGPIIEPIESVEFIDFQSGLARLREPFPPERIEKRPQPTIDNASWKKLPRAHCNVCGGYHPLQNTIHLDFVGHANTTDRLLEVDPLWSWEPLALTEAGTPLFSDGGLWIKLTICGVTRIGFGDGSSVKEVIGDAIRNAAMRFGVALDLWSKVDLHAGTNVGTASSGRDEAGDQVHGTRGATSGGVSGQKPGAAPENDDALKSLASVCKDYGYFQSGMRELWNEWLDENPERPREDLIAAAGEDIIAFAAHLIEAAPPKSDGGSTPGAGSDQAPQPETGVVGDDEAIF
jgi:hypothetical protein